MVKPGNEITLRPEPAENGWALGTPGRVQDRFAQAGLLHSQVSRYLSALRRRWWIFVLSLTVVGGPALFYAAHKAPTFQSQALMWLAGKLTVPGMGTYTEELNSYIGTQAALLKSANIQFRAFEKVRASFPRLFPGKGGNPGMDLPFELNVRYSTKNSVLELRAVGPAPEPTQAFLDGVMAEYEDFKKASRERTSSGALSGITEQVHEVERQLQAQQKQVTDFQASNNVSFLTEHGLSAGSHLAKLGELLSDLRTELHILEMLTPAQFSGLAARPPAVISETSVPGEKLAQALAVNTPGRDTAYYQAMQQLQLLKAKRDEFSKVLRPTHSKMVKFEQEITGLQHLIKTLEDQSEEQARVQMDNRKKSLQLQVENLESQYRAWETNAAQASLKLAEYDRLKQEVQRSQALFDRLMALVQTFDVNNNLEVESLRPIAPASPAKATMAKLEVAAAGLFLSLLVGLGCFLGLELLDDRFTSARELSLHLPVEVVGQIPETRLISGHREVRLLAAANAEPAFAESFRNLRSSLLFMSGQNPPPRIVLVTSAIPKEGKTTVSSNLAEVLALSGSRVVLVDADFRRGSVHRLFGVRRRPGMLEALSGELALAEAIVPTSNPNLFILPAGEAANCSSDMLLTYRVEHMLRTLAGKYDHVVIDSAPVLATDDAACLGPYTDGAFLVVRAAYTSSRMTQEACERLQRRSVRLLGLIYNYAPQSTDYYCQYSRDYYARNGSEVQPETGPEAAPDPAAAQAEQTAEQD